jgi:hypothetical protein
MNAMRSSGEWTRISGTGFRRLSGDALVSVRNFSEWKERIGVYVKGEPQKSHGYANDVDAINAWYENKAIFHTKSVERAASNQAKKWLDRRCLGITRAKTEWIEDMRTVDMGPILEALPDGMCRQVKYNRMTSPVSGLIRVYDKEGRVHVVDTLVNQALRTHALSAGFQVVEESESGESKLTGRSINGSEINIDLVKSRCRRVGIVRTPDFTILTGLRVELSRADEIERVWLFAHILPEVTASAYNISTLDTERIIRDEGRKLDFYPGKAEVPFYVDAFFRKPENPVRSRLQGT